MAGPVTRDALVSANVTWPLCPRCAVDTASAPSYDDDDGSDLTCSNCGQRLRVGNPFDEGGLKIAWEVGERGWPGWSA